MPRGDKTGPNGDGPMTGRAMGYCNEDNAQTNVIPGGRGIRCGGSYQRGFGRGNRNWVGSSNPAPNITENSSLKEEIKIIREQLSDLQKLVTKK